MDNDGWNKCTLGANTASTGVTNTNVTASGTLSVKTGATTLGNLSGTGSISGFDANLTTDVIKQ